MPMNGNDMGDAVYDAMMSIAMNQNSTESDDIGRARMRAGCTALVNYIKANADILPLTVTETPNGTGPHVHDPISTIQATGKIS